MSSPSEAHQTKPESGSSPSTCHITNQPPLSHPQSTSAPGGHPPAPGYPAPPMGYPPQMGYPPPNGQAGYHQPQMGYPSPGYNQYAYAQAPPAAYYRPGYSPQANGCSGLARGILAALIFLVVLILILCLITWIILRPNIPILRVDTISVSNFNTSIPFTAKWDTNVYVENPNHKLRVYFDRIESLMYYDDNDVLGSTYATQFFLETQAKTTISVSISANGSAQNSVPIWISQRMEKDRASSGSVVFSLRFNIRSTFKTGSWWSRGLRMRVLCEDLKINFSGSSPNGTLASGKQKECLVYV